MYVHTYIEVAGASPCRCCGYTARENVLLQNGVAGEMKPGSELTSLSQTVAYRPGGVKDHEIKFCDHTNLEEPI
jgi:hypothetical protein